MADLRAVATLGYKTSAVGAVKLRSVANLGYFVGDLAVILDVTQGTVILAVDVTDAVLVVDATDLVLPVNLS